MGENYHSDNSKHKSTDTAFNGLARGNTSIELMFAKHFTRQIGENIVCPQKAEHQND